ncbi:uncharacterized protein L201_002947 [Kwoniella dendrophila CBS 6074]|uniref:histone acetyltransferase n=1 Tax=Kwoniella dendrophila CBS 6074 TaxID=1295534 RepID=A0AAX4JTC0_9TREE
MSITTSSLRGHLSKSLAELANPHDLGMTVIASEPKKTSSIFPHTPIPPKCFQQEFLVVLSSNLPSSTLPPSAVPSLSISTEDEKGKKKVLVTAISAYLYTFPLPGHERKSNSILYISKIDSSGYSPTPLPLTRMLIVSFLEYFLLNLQNIRIQLFARSQNQYLFANSSKNQNKKVLTGSGLCKWWKSVYEQTVIAYIKSKSQLKEQEVGIEKGDDYGEAIQLKYLLPGYAELESQIQLGQSKNQLPHSIRWEYKPPFDTPIIPPFTPSSSSLNPASGLASSSYKLLPESLATLIPSLPDDPKTRFLEELVTDGYQKNPHSTHRTDNSGKESDTTSTRTNPNEPSIVKKTKKEKELEEELNDRKQSHLALSINKVNKIEFWERIGFRQECGGDVTGFFTLEKTQNMPVKPKAKVAQLKDQSPAIAPEAGLESAVQNKTTSTTASDVVDTITSLDPESASIPILAQDIDKEKEVKEVDIPKTSESPEISKSQISKSHKSATTLKDPSMIRTEIINRLLVALTNIDFENLDLSIEGTEIWLKQTKSIMIGEIGLKNYEQNCLSIIPKKDNLPQVDFNEKGVKGVEVRKERQEEVVTMLQPRKKKKLT